MREDLDGWIAAPRCPECGELDCRWWLQRRVHELASMGMGAALERAIAEPRTPNDRPDRA